MINLDAKAPLFLLLGKMINPVSLRKESLLGTVWKAVSGILGHERAPLLPDAPQAMCWQLAKEGAHDRT